jgi:hypothetical protein
VLDVEQSGIEMVPAPQLERSAESGETYVKAWRRFAVRHHLAQFLLFGWIPVCVGLFLLSRYWIHQPVVSLVIMVLWLLAALAAVWWAGEFRCPRCSRRYAALGHGRHVNLTRGMFDKICSNCKLTKFEK